MKEQSSALRLRIDIFVAHLLLAMAKAGKSGEPNAEVCFYLGDCYSRLAEYYRDKGATAKARTLQTKAQSYLRASGWWNEAPIVGHWRCRYLNRQNLPLQ